MSMADADIETTPARALENTNQPFLLVSCEHGGNDIPAEYRHYFASYVTELTSHRGYDAGALELAQAMAETLNGMLVTSTTSRLLIDLNRSPHHRKLYSEMLKRATPEVRRAIFEKHYLPYRQKIEQTIRDAIAAGRPVLHISCHSFTPVLDDEVRRADIGLLYDPTRAIEAKTCRQWQRQLTHQLPQMKARLNYPYRGTADGLTTHLRRLHGPNVYQGIELEINQAQVVSPHWRMLQMAVIAALAQSTQMELQSLG